MAEMEEGWPRSWIVTTAILGIVAIIIVARLVGQSWKQGPTVPRPGAQVAAKGQAPAQGKAPGKVVHNAPPKGKAPGKMGTKAPPPPSEGGGQAVKETVLIELSNLKVAPGAYCVTRDNKLHKLKDQFERAEQCQVIVPEEKGKWYRVSLGNVEPAGELQIFIQPPKGVDAQFASLYTRFPHGGATQWFGAKMLHAPKPPADIAMVVANPTKKEVTAKKIKLTLRSSGQRNPGELVARKEFKGISVETSGSFCVSTEGKLFKLKNFEERPPENCKFDVTGSNMLRMELKHKTQEGRIQFQLRPLSSGVPVLMESMMMGSPGAEEHMDMLEGHLMEEASMVAMVFHIDMAPKAKLTITSLTMIAKHRPLDAP